MTAAPAPATVLGWTATVPLPPRELSPNARRHWGTKRRVAIAYVTRCLVALREQGIFPPRAPWPRVEIRLAFYVLRVADHDNRVASLKALLDGLVRAGYFAGDDPARLVFAAWPTQTLAPKERCRLELTVTALP